MDTNKPKYLLENRNIKEWISIKEACILFNKSIYTFKKLIQHEKVKHKKVKGKHGDESRLYVQSLLEYYNTTIDNLDNKHLLNSISLNNNISKVKEINQFENEHNKLIELLQKQIQSLEKDKQDLQKIIEQKDIQINTQYKIIETQLEKQSKLFENQQTISLNLQSQLLSGPDKQNLISNKQSDKPKKKLFGFLGI